MNRANPRLGGTLANWYRSSCSINCHRLGIPIFQDAGYTTVGFLIQKPKDATYIMSENNNLAKYANWIAATSALISVIALLASVKSCDIAREALAEASEPKIVSKVASDKAFLSNEGKGVGEILTIAYTHNDDEEPKCLNEIKEIPEIKQNYEIYSFDKQEPLKAEGGEQEFLICKNDCGKGYHKEYNFYASYKNPNKEKISHTPNSTPNIIKKLSVLKCQNRD